MRKYVEYKLDKTRNLKLGMVALSKIKNKLGKSINKIDFEDEMDFNEIAVILWAAMSHEDSELTPEKVMELIDEYSSIPKALEIMAETMNEAFGNEQQGNDQRTADK